MTDMYFDKRYFLFLSYKYLIFPLKICYYICSQSYRHLAYLPIHSIFESKFGIKNYCWFKLTNTQFVLIFENEIVLIFKTTFQILWGSCAYIFASNVFMFSIWLVYFLAFDDEYALALWPP